MGVLDHNLAGQSVINLGISTHSPTHPPPPQLPPLPTLPLSIQFLLNSSVFPPPSPPPPPSTSQIRIHTSLLQFLPNPIRNPGSPINNILDRLRIAVSLAFLVFDVAEISNDERKEDEEVACLGGVSIVIVRLSFVYCIT